MTHAELCLRGKVWLRGTRRCRPVFSNCASVDEIPDAIGWSSSYKWHGSTVVEAKTSLSDFRADQKKRFEWVDPKNGYHYSMRRFSATNARELGLVKRTTSLMGDFRFYMCEPGIIPEWKVRQFAPDHGLLYVRGRQVLVVVDAPRREGVNTYGEIRYLRFAIINRKVSAHE